MSVQQNNPAAHECFDVVICGGGLVGASLSLMLQSLQLKVALIEAKLMHSAHNAPQPSFDERTTALSNGSRRIFEALAVWPLLQHTATPIERIHVSDQGRFGFARLTAQEQKLTALGYVVINRLLGVALWQRLQTTAVTVIAPAEVQSIHTHADHCTVQLNTAAPVQARLCIAADGAHSTACTAVGIHGTTQDYGQTAIVAHATTQRFHDYVAYERFTPHGPIAVLPLHEARVGIVWTVATSAAESLLTCSDNDFLTRLQQQFGLRLGRFVRVGQRYAYPLALTRASAHTAPRFAVIGNAAQALHPIAGQGLNLGLRDAACLAEILADAQRMQKQDFDAGNATLLQRYADWRIQDSSRIVQFTDGLLRTFSQPLGVVKTMRDLGLLAFDLLPPAKDALAQLSLGAAGKIPRLARGAPL